MCFACEQDAIWRAYLQTRGLRKPGDPAAAEALFAAFPVPPPPLPPVQQEQGERAVTVPFKISERKEQRGKNSFSCDDPTAE
jgi:hypothetical protein